MSARRAKAPASEAAGPGLDRRTFLGAALAAGLFPRELLALPELPEATREALASSPYVYVSPLRRSGAESRCHGEVWFAWLDGAVRIVTGAKGWKARAVAAGLDRARLWVGDHGPWKRTLGTSEEFRRGPSFVAGARASRDRDLLERMLGVYERKYPAEIGRWRERFRDGLASGERVILSYAPL
jgi:hypothetical protein